MLKIRTIIWAIYYRIKHPEDSALLTIIEMAHEMSLKELRESYQYMKALYEKEENNGD
jgi:hypothetical protein